MLSSHSSNLFLVVAYIVGSQVSVNELVGCRPFLQFLLGSADVRVGQYSACPSGGVDCTCPLHLPVNDPTCLDCVLLIIYVHAAMVAFILELPSASHCKFVWYSSLELWERVEQPFHLIICTRRLK